MNDENLIIAKRWETLSDIAKACHLGQARVRDLAEQVGTRWYSSRGDERLHKFLNLDGKGIFQLESLGKAKISKLCDILEDHTDSKLREKLNLEPALKPLECLKLWHIPINFPRELISLPTRISHFCEMKKIMTVGHLILEWERLGETGFMAENNLGMRSVKKLGAFMDSLATGNRAEASRFLPIALDGMGADFAVSVEHVIAKQTPIKLEMLQNRLVDRLSLEKSAKTRGLSRERVRQMEGGFLDLIELRLDYFSELRKRLIESWLEEEEWFALVGWHGSEELGTLVKAALEDIFRASPQGVARQKAEDARTEIKMERLRIKLIY